jgi:hypothetical protein
MFRKGPEDGDATWKPARGVAPRCNGHAAQHFARLTEAWENRRSLGVARWTAAALRRWSLSPACSQLPHSVGRARLPEVARTANVVAARGARIGAPGHGQFAQRCYPN